MKLQLYTYHIFLITLLLSILEIETATTQSKPAANELTPQQRYQRIIDNYYKLESDEMISEMTTILNTVKDDALRVKIYYWLIVEYAKRQELTKTEQLFTVFQQEFPQSNWTYLAWIAYCDLLFREGYFRQNLTELERLREFDGYKNVYEIDNRLRRVRRYIFRRGILRGSFVFLSLSLLYMNFRIPWRKVRFKDVLTSWKEWSVLVFILLIVILFRGEISAVMMRSAWQAMAALAVFLALNNIFLQRVSLSHWLRIVYPFIVVLNVACILYIIYYYSDLVPGFEEFARYLSLDKAPRPH